MQRLEAKNSCCGDPKPKWQKTLCFFTTNILDAMYQFSSNHIFAIPSLNSYQNHINKNEPWSVWITAKLHTDSLQYLHLFLHANSESIYLKTKFTSFQSYVNTLFGRWPYWGHLSQNLLCWHWQSKDYLFRSTYDPQTDTFIAVLEKMPKWMKKRCSWSSTLWHLEPLAAPAPKSLLQQLLLGYKRILQSFYFCFLVETP